MGRYRVLLYGICEREPRLREIGVQYRGLTSCPFWSALAGDYLAMFY
jgi:hypothetical protein